MKKITSSLRVSGRCGWRCWTGLASVVVLMVLAATVGCTTTNALRQADCDPEAAKARKCLPSAYPIPVSSSTPEARRPYIVYMEYDDNGKAHDAALPPGKSQADKALAEIERLAKGGNLQETERPLLIVTFIHGWHHNAAKKDPNVEAFTDFLLKLQATEDLALEAGSGIPGKSRQVVGVYIGWRGESIALWPLNYLTLWNRKAVAEKIGEGDLPEFLGKLEEFRNREEGSSHRLVLVGHSLGGAMLYTAAKQRLVEGIAGARTVAGEPAPVRNVYGDLLVLINPALEAEHFQDLHDVANKIGSFNPQQNLLMASFTSETDWATKLPFKFVASLRNRVWPFSAPTPRTQAYGHYTHFVTATLDDKGDATLAERPAGPYLDGTSYQAAVCSWQQFRKDAKGEMKLQSIRLRHHEFDADNGLDPVYRIRNAPFMNVQVSEGLIQGHNEIWSEDFSRYLRALIGVRFTAKLRLDSCDQTNANNVVGDKAS